MAQIEGYKERLDLAKLKGVSVVDVDGETMIQIPIEGNPIYISDKTKSIYFDLVVTKYFKPQYGASHYVKPSVNKDVYIKMTETDRKSLPIIGTLKPLVNSSYGNNTNENQNRIVTINDLPF
jgi:hypothetical protein